MKPALPANSQPPMDIHLWHRQVDGLLESSSDKRLNEFPKVLGRMWEHWASEIFLANSHVPFWGWAEASSIRLLEFWQGFDPRVNFVLLFTNVEALVATYLEQSGREEGGGERLLREWRDYSQALLKFARSNPKRCLALDVLDALSAPEVTLRQLRTKWRLPLVVPTNMASTTPPLRPNAVMRLIVSHLLQQEPAVSELQREINSLISPCGERSHTALDVDQRELISGYRALCDRSREQARIGLLQEQSERLNQLYHRTLSNYKGRYLEFLNRNKQSAYELEQLKSQLASVKGDSQNRVCSLEKELEALRESDNEKNETLKVLEARLSDSVQENELLLLHLHQTQEQLVDAILKQETTQRIAQNKVQQLESELSAVLKMLESKTSTSEALQQRVNQLEIQNSSVSRQQEVLEQRFRESTEENESLLLQLHQAQEDLESLLIQYKAQRREHENALSNLRGQLEVSIRESDALRSESKRQKEELVQTLRDLENYQQAKKRAEAQLAIMVNEREKMASEMAVQEKRINQVVKEREQLLKQFSETKLNLEGLTKREEFLSQQLNRKAKEIEEAEQAVNSSRLRIQSLEVKNRALEELVSSLNAEIKKLHASNDRNLEILKKAEFALQAATEENEITLVQLHRVQEELETYFEEAQLAKQECKKISERLRKMQESYPDYVEHGVIEVGVDNRKALNWRVRDLSLMGCEFGELSFSTVIEHGMAGFVFRKSEAASREFLASWSLFEGDNEITLLPLATPAQVQKRSAALLSLSTSEWERLKGLTRFLISMLQDDVAWSSVLVKGDLNVREWAEALRTLNSDLMQFPSVPRFDEMALKNQQVNPDYEHLWLEFKNFSFGGKRVPNFEFRISCANVRPGVFGRFPKLEFPFGGSSIFFESWFEESDDDFGPKLELRFAEPDSMDLGVWEKLSVADKKLVRSLIKYLPAWIARLEVNNHRLNRPLSDWICLAESVSLIAQKILDANKSSVSKEPSPKFHSNHRASVPVSPKDVVGILPYPDSKVSQEWAIASSPKRGESHGSSAENEKEADGSNQMPTLRPPSLSKKRKR